MRRDPILQQLVGDVEVDETYVGGKPRDKGDNKRGRGTKKAAVLVLVERDGRAVARPIENVGGKTLRKAIREMVSKESRILTDEFRSYIGIGDHFDGGHATVNHSEDQFVKGDVYTNTAESFFALLKRGVMGTFHHVSKRHLARYCDEFSFRWDHRRTTDGERTVAAIQSMVGKRLLYSSMSA
jgi:transposase-like protein